MPITWEGTGTVVNTDEPPSANLELWYDASQMGLANNDPVTTLTDFSGFSRNGTSVAPNTPLYKSSGGPNNLPYILFDGVNDEIVVPNFMGAFPAGHIFGIAMQTRGDPPAVQNAGIWTSWGNNAGLSEDWPATDGKVIDGFGSTVRKTATVATSQPSSWCCYEALSKTGEWTSRFNGTTYFTTAANTVGWHTIFGPKLGINPNLSRFQGGMSEILFYSAEVTGADLVQMYLYIANKFAFIFP